MLQSLFVFLTILAVVQSACDNGCSGHGTCTRHGVCKCYDNWGVGLSHLSGDCSERICPFELAWVDTPDKIGSFHKYAECANRGICNRDTGECECFPGYEGKACQRTACPNDCSGHGRCMYIQNLPFGAVAQDFQHTDFFQQEPETFNYLLWDNAKTRGCYCDAGYGDVDCSKRLCDQGTDVMDLRPDLTNPAKHQIQNIVFDAHAPTLSEPGGLYGKTFALTFKSKLNETFTTEPIIFPTGPNDLPSFLLDVEQALKRLPNRVIDDVDVSGSFDAAGSMASLNVTFTGNHVQGPQNLLTVRSYECGDGCTPKITGLDLQLNTMSVLEKQRSDFNSYECGRRGKCDYTTGVCNCFAGYSGATCATISCLV